ncbi:DUF2809 domain-containing protein [Hymenobacter sp. BRD128]|uniref:ribosomal maturation YjgA family protein n=1 Tax=Hymenobacter sp. BRD128 TaxID=2675878 RepID=UPI001563CC63|nr:DUF2809 domain-containing protein [Hymenobacter sp. BRD128]QKG56393.1 DUF2809 domain-containing protein [Hymenobacter sp. BRD128]
MVRWNYTYALFAAGLLALEIFIARFVHDGLVRPYLGDTLATVLLYCLLKSIWRVPAGLVALAALLVSYAIETTQALHLLAWLGWQHARVARLVLGSQFAWGDMLAYTLGAAVVLGAERLRARRSLAKVN